MLIKPAEHEQSNHGAHDTDQDACDADYPPENVDDTDLPPKLEEFIPGEFFPEALVVHDSGSCASGVQGYIPDWKKSGQMSWSEGTKQIRTLRYRRVLPPACDEREKNPITGYLRLSAKRMHGRGHHSSVYRATLIPPAPLTTNSRSKDGEMTVIAKMAFDDAEDVKHLYHEAGILHQLSRERYRHLQQEWCGLNVIRNLRHAVPIGPVVPKFYGFYVPEYRISDKTCDDCMSRPGYRFRSTERLSPILLTEDCGTPVKPEELSHAQR